MPPDKDEKPSEAANQAPGDAAGGTVSQEPDKPKDRAAVAPAAQSIAGVSNNQAHTVLERLLSREGVHLVRKNYGALGLGVLGLGIVSDLSQVFGSPTVWVVSICGVAIAGFLLLLKFRPHFRTKCAIPLAAVTGLFVVSLMIFAAQKAFAAEEHGIAGTYSQEIRSLQNALLNSLGRIEEKVDIVGETTVRTETKIENLSGDVRALREDVAAYAQQKDPSGDFIRGSYVTYLAARLIEQGVPQEELEGTITLAIDRYIAGRGRLEARDALPGVLDAKRNAALKLYDEARLDEAEALLEEIIAEQQLNYEQAVRDRSTLLGDRAIVAEAKLESMRAMDLYEQAADTINGLGTREASLQSWRWLNYGGTAGFKRAKIVADRIYLDRSIELFKKALILVETTDQPSRPNDPRHAKAWALTQQFLGESYTILGKRGDDNAAAKAVAALRASLSPDLPEQKPYDVAGRQLALGNALMIFGDRGEDRAFEEGVEMYRQALNGFSKEDYPGDWAAAQMNLGNTLTTRFERGDDTRAGEAISAYDEALSIYTRDDYPQRWALAQSNRAVLLLEVGKQGDMEAYREAIAVNRLVLEVYTREDLPLDWARTQFNLGNTSMYLAAAVEDEGEDDDEELLEQAVSAFDAALSVYTSEDTPRQWATVQVQHGLALAAMDRIEEGLARVIEAEEIFRSIDPDHASLEDIQEIKKRIEDKR